MSKEVLRWPFPSEPYPGLWKLGSNLVLPIVGACSKIWLCYLNNTKFHNVDVIRKAVSHRAKGHSLITVSNHTSCMDDPLLAGMLSWRQIFTPSLYRWTLAAHEICFSRDSHSKFFGLGRSIPIIRGNGVFQKGLTYSIKKLNQGEWVHVFPEGKIIFDPKSWIRLRWGVGRMIYESEKTPVVVPIIHVGMDKVLPSEKKPFIPRIGNRVAVVVGNPIDVSEAKKNSKNMDPTEARIYLTSIVQEQFDLLKADVYNNFFDEFQVKS